MLLDIHFTCVTQSVTKSGLNSWIDSPHRKTIQLNPFPNRGPLWSRGASVRLSLVRPGSCSGVRRLPPPTGGDDVIKRLSRCVVRTIGLAAPSLPPPGASRRGLREMSRGHRAEARAQTEGLRTGAAWNKPDAQGVESAEDQFLDTVGVREVGEIPVSCSFVTRQNTPEHAC